jgi:hypothetical protein
MEPIDFDEASRAWRANKVVLGHGYFAYRCQYLHRNGRQCPKVVSAQSRTPHYRIREDWIKVIDRSSDEFCVRHRIRGPIQKYFIQE